MKATHPALQAKRAPLRLSGVIALALVALAGCRGSVSEDPPIHIIQDMDFQPKFLPQSENDIFPDHRSQRPLVEGTVPHGLLKADTAFYQGQENGQYLARMPLDKVEKALAVDSLEKVMKRGQNRFNIYCTPCHDRTGEANGLAVQHGFPKPVKLTDQAPMALSDGELFHYISYGGGANMPGYALQIPEADRWAIVSWVRVLQRSQHATLADVPSQMQGQIEPQEAQ